MTNAIRYDHLIMQRERNKLSSSVFILEFGAADSFLNFKYSRVL